MIELMVGLLLAAILSAVAVPMYRDYVDNQRLRAVSSDLHLALTLARSEAVKRARPVQLQPVDDGWGSGWVIPSPVVGEPDILNQVHGEAVAITGPAQIQFNAFGRAGGAAEFEIDIGAGGELASSCMTMAVDGRTTTEKGGCPDEDA